MKRLTENWLKAYIKYTSQSDAPSIYHIWVGISVLAGAVRDNVHLRLGYFELFPHFYVCLVGPSGGRKTTASDIGIRLLENIDGVRIKRDKITPERLIRYLAERGKVTVKKDESKAIIEPSRTLFIYAPEFSTLIGSTSYADSLQEVLTRLYDATPFEYSLVSSRDIYIEKFNVNLLACSTPEWLARGIQGDSIAGGFVGRFILPTNMSYQTIKPKALPVLSDELRELETKLVHDLHHISKLEGEFTMEQDTLEAYSKWYESMEYIKAAVVDKGFHSRKPTHVLKVMMILSIAERDDLVLTLDHYKTARYLIDVVDKHVEEALMFVGATDELQIQQIIMEALEDGPKAYNELLALTRKYLKSINTLNNAITILQLSGLVTRVSRGGVVEYMLTEQRKKILADKMNVRLG